MCAIEVLPKLIADTLNPSRGRVYRAAKEQLRKVLLNYWQAVASRTDEIAEERQEDKPVYFDLIDAE